MVRSDRWPFGAVVESEAAVGCITIEQRLGYARVQEESAGTLIQGIDDDEQRGNKYRAMRECKTQCEGEVTFGGDEDEGYGDGNNTGERDSTTE